MEYLGHCIDQYYDIDDKKVLWKLDIWFAGDDKLVKLETVKKMNTRQEAEKCFASLQLADQAKEIELHSTIKDLTERLNELERVVRECSRVVRQKYVAPFQCPVCEGAGFKAHSERISVGNYAVGHTDCKACEGKGVIWSSS